MDYLEKIAKELGVSRCTVYRAIKYMKPMSAETRKKVLDYIKVNYPDKLEQLNNDKKDFYAKRIVSIMPYKPEYFWNEVKDGMDSARKELSRYPVEIKYLYYSGTISEKELGSFLDSFEFGNADGLCLVPVNSDLVAEKISSLAERIPVAVMNEFCDGVNSFLNVTSDGFTEGGIVGKMVREHCQVGSHVLILSPSVIPNVIFKDRINGFISELKKDSDGVGFFVDNIEMDIANEYTYNTILPSLMAREIQNIIQKVEKKGETVSAVYVQNGCLLPLLKAMKKLGRSDILVFGHEKDEKSIEYFESGMGGGYVKQNAFLQGYTAVYGIIEKIFIGKSRYSDTITTDYECKFFERK